MTKEIYIAKPKRIVYVLRSIEEIVMGISCIFLPVLILLLAKVSLKEDILLIIFASLFIIIGFCILVIGPVVRIIQADSIRYVLKENELSIMKDDQVKKSYEYPKLQKAIIEETIVDKGNRTLSISLFKDDKNNSKLITRLYGLDPGDAIKIIKIIKDEQ